MNNYPTCSICDLEATWAVEHTADASDYHMIWACDHHASMRVADLMLERAAREITLNRLTPDYVAFMSEGTQANA